MNNSFISEYNTARDYLIRSNSELILEEEYKATNTLSRLLLDNINNIKSDFDGAGITKRYWELYAPIQRGFKPRGEAYPWGEVGEKVIEGHVYSQLKNYFDFISFPGMPYGHDIRFFNGTSVIHIDVKSTGPTDDVNEVVSSPNQVTGNGKIHDSGLIYNDFVDMKGPRITRQFRPELSPFYLIDNKIIPVLTFYIKAVYNVHFLGDQPLAYVELICVPNGMPMFESPNYNHLFPGILTPGKDEVHVERKRTRIKLYPLSNIDKWRCVKIQSINNIPNSTYR